MSALTNLATSTFAGLIGCFMYSCRHHWMNGRRVWWLSIRWIICTFPIIQLRINDNRRSAFWVFDDLGCICKRDWTVDKSLDVYFCFINEMTYSYHWDALFPQYSILEESNKIDVLNFVDELNSSIFLVELSEPWEDCELDVSELSTSGCFSNCSKWSSLPPNTIG